MTMKGFIYIYIIHIALLAPWKFMHMSFSAMRKCVRLLCINGNKCLIFLNLLLNSLNERRE